MAAISKSMTEKEIAAINDAYIHTALRYVCSLKFQICFQIDLDLLLYALAK